MFTCALPWPKKIVTRMLTRDFQDGFRLSVDTEAIKNLEIMSCDYGF